MKKFAFLLTVFLFVTLLLQSKGVEAGVAGDEPAPPALDGNTSKFPGGKPDLVEGHPADGPWAIATEPRGSLNVEAAPTQPTINIWYGDFQSFGQIGNPQQWINILGSVSGPNDIDSLTYSLNGGVAKNLSMGPDGYRLAEDGDFNVELRINDLNDGNNTLEITAVDTEDEETTKNVTIDYSAGNVWPENYSIDWTSSPPVQSVAQVVDGQWTTQNGVLQPLTFDYDRLVAIGDETWTDYEITFPMNVHAIDTSGFGGPSNGAGVGVFMRWQGHNNLSGEQPNRGWDDLGALTWYRWSPQNSEGLEMLGGGGAWITGNPLKELEFDVQYMVKASVQSSPTGPAYYRFKMWKAADPEPVAWDMESAGLDSEPDSGSMMLVSHHVDVAFGNVTVKKLDDIRFTVNSTVNGDGSLDFVPPEPEDGYTYASQVGIWAIPVPGNIFDGWSGDFTGDANPLGFNITKDINLTANFSPAPPSEITVDIVGQGEVLRDPPGPEYLYAEEVELTAVPDTDYLFAGWGGALSGIANPITLVMDGDKTVVANFIHKSLASPVSDDFSYCGDLDSDLWTFVNPGDGSKQLTGSTLELSVPEGTANNMWTGNKKAPRILQDTLDQDFEIEVKFETIPDERYQLEGLLVETDDNNWLRFDFFHDGSTLFWHAGVMEDGAASTFDVNPINAGNNDDIYMRVQRNGNIWTQSYSYDGTSWTQASQFFWMMEVNQTGVFVGNEINNQDIAPAFTGVVDYFFNTGAPIDPEDGGTNGQKVINVNTSGEGTVNLSPNGSYSCDQVVTLTANPASGWVFLEWGGDLSGSNNPDQITISKNHNVLAVFVEGDANVYLPIIKHN